MYLGGAISADRELSIEITRCLQRAWECFQRYKAEIYDPQGVRLRLKVRMLKAVIETLLYGCVTWSPNEPDCDRLRRAVHPMLLVGWREQKRNNHTLSYSNALARTDFESIETTVRSRRVLLAGFEARMGEERLSRRMMFRDVYGVRIYPRTVFYGAVRSNRTAP